LKATKSYGIQFHIHTHGINAKFISHILATFADSDFASTTDRKSHSGFVTLLNAHQFPGSRRNNNSPPLQRARQSSWPWLALVQAIDLREFHIQHIATTKNVADLFTKPLPRPSFEKHRNSLLQECSSD